MPCLHAPEWRVCGVSYMHFRVAHMGACAARASCVTLACVLPALCMLGSWFRVCACCRIAHALTCTDVIALTCNKDAFAWAFICRFYADDKRWIVTRLVDNVLRRPGRIFRHGYIERSDEGKGRAGRTQCPCSMLAPLIHAIVAKDPNAHAKACNGARNANEHLICMLH